MNNYFFELLGKLLIFGYFYYKNHKIIIFQLENDLFLPWIVAPFVKRCLTNICLKTTRNIRSLSPDRSTQAHPGAAKPLENKLLFGNRNFNVAIENFHKILPLKENAKHSVLI